MQCRTVSKAAVRRRVASGAWSPDQLSVPLRVFHRMTMKAMSPVRSVRSCYEAVCCVSQQSVAISRGKGAVDEPGGALCDMNLCYSRLKELVPSIPQNRSVSQVEILQHVIDYILDLQTALEAASPEPAGPEVVLSLQTADMARHFPREDGGLCH
ncbi:DNA-binding protein inhibitor ID-3 [Scleropages formosus]|uniref:Inhibitor of DNA binding 3 n=1 Tax=Scleropages formosus TaxID=113540 RepID=A0A8C9QQF8_SCLFO|nr:DNA-binding protein inhibitor ID-3 [Scleropages formosus]